MSLETYMLTPPGQLAPEAREPAAREARRRGLQAARDTFAHDPQLLVRAVQCDPMERYTRLVLGDAPEEGQRPWATADEETLLADPRVCAFADGFERERLRLLGREPLPEDLPALEGWVSMACTLLAGQQ